jgi:FMN phosphatase YigB (HAD superfamily)
MMSKRPSVLVFDVNETLLDIESMAPLFARVFGDPNVLREWFNQLVLYSMATTLSEHYADFPTLAQGVLEMLADELGADAAACMMVAAHPWDLIGAQRAGYSSTLITRPGNAPLRVDALPQPTLVAPDLRDLAKQLAQS